MAGTRYVTPSSLGEQTAAWMAAIDPWSRGRGLPRLDRSALLVLDVQRFFADPGSHAFLPALEAVLPQILSLVRGFFAAGRPVIYTRHGSEPGTRTLMQRWWGDDLRRGEQRSRLVGQLEQVGPPDLELHKSLYSAFCGTELEQWLASRRCEAMVICGVMTHLCCESTARQAFMLDLAPVMVADACASRDEDLHVGALRGLAHGFAVVSTTAGVLHGLPEPGAGTGGSAIEPTEENKGIEGSTTGPTEQISGIEAVSATDSEIAPLDLSADLAVVGAGPGGLAAAIQARRADLDVLVLDPGRPGGLARTAERVENYPGFPGGISGRSLMDRFVAQAAGVGVRPRILLEVEAVQRREQGLTLVLAGGRGQVRARTMILATGTSPRGLRISGMRSVSRVDQLPRSLRNQRILVVGGGEAALDQALLARRRGASEVRVAMRGARPRAMALLVRRCRDRGIQLDLETNLVNVLGGEGDGPLTVELEHRGQRQEVEMDAVVVCIGKDPRLPALPDGVELSAAGHPAVDRLGRTGVEGLYVVGDACRGRYRQVSIAVGDGVAAAMHAVGFLGNQISWRE